MCFRPSAVAGGNVMDGMQEAKCPNCGQPIVAKIGTESGTCPYCEKPIPAEGGGSSNLTQSVRIL